MLEKIIKNFKDKKRSNFGYIDFFTSGRSRGWAFSENHNLNQVTFYVNENKIATSKINQKREDIMKLFGTKRFCGFEFFFKREDMQKILKGEPKFVVEDKNKNEIFELELLSKFKKEKSNDTSLYKYFGFDGENYDLNDQGLLTGWAAVREKDNKAISIWLQTKEFNPIEIKCDQWISDLSLHKVPSTSSFEIDVNKLPKELSEKSIFFSFDKEGLYHVGLENQIILPKIDNDISIESLPNKKIDNEDEINIFRNNLEEFSSLLDSI